MNGKSTQRRTIQVIDLENYADVWFWSRYLEVPADRLREVVAEVGPEMNRVRRHLLRSNRAAEAAIEMTE
jgi:hypothetical protein